MPLEVYEVERNRVVKAFRKLKENTKKLLKKLRIKRLQQEEEAIKEKLKSMFK